MKLLQKINRDYLLVSIAVYIISLIFFYFILIGILNEELRENLSIQEIRVMKLIENNRQVPEMYPLIELKEVETLKERIYKDTALYDPIEKEMENFKELNAYHKIGGRNYYIVLRAKAVENDDFAMVVFWLLAAILFISMTALIYLNRRITRQVWSPFYNNLQLIKSFSLRNESGIKLEHSGIHEFETLNSTVEQLMDQVILDYRNLKQFTENAAHELQTPLSVIKARMEVLLNDKELTASQVETIHGVDRAISQLSKLNKNLLLLTKIENQQFPFTENIIMNDLILKTIEDLSELAKLKKLQLGTELKHLVKARINKDLGEILLKNIFSNAITHTPTNGHVRVETRDQQIIFSNSGNAPITESSRIYDRFYKAEPSSTSTGLGLSIVKAICDQNNFKIHYDFKDGMHQFILDF